ncbi:3-phytase A [Sodiomyces alkalinus F11]|uniref:Phytase A n=1 Tax=Sodiomyces alkalinus (strain CBS 110278 / VKM F-3762 / F11) TaxID=1314773 RepID=A0A3N2Q1F0_SODAK|nr:3-phytase A [Sodiomyces alkalinus F11]ROT40589.1 3-phytase A [Sodiomyces alkalinus F11]
MGFSDMTASLKRLISGENNPRYTAIPASNSVTDGGNVQIQSSGSRWLPQNRRLLRVLGALVFVTLVVHLGVVLWRITNCKVTGNCQEEDHTQLWGQYSPFYPVPSDFDRDVPAQCEVTFAQVLSRHGSRDPTVHKSAAYRELLAQIQETVEDYAQGYEFIRDHKYTLGADQLTAYGRREMKVSGTAFYRRYRALAASSEPFVRVSGQQRVIDSGLEWMDGFLEAKQADGHEVPGAERADWEGRIVVVPEEEGTNNTLSHGLCSEFEEGPFSRLGGEAQTEWRDVFMPPVAARVNAHLPGANLTHSELVYLMDLCPFSTVADPDLTLSPFCGLFTLDEWRDYDYYQTVGKYYAYNEGNPLGPTQGVGFVNELVARLTGRPVQDRTSTNETLVGDEETFPLGRALYADFSHDNDMMGIYGALGLYGEEATGGPLPKAERLSALEAGGFASRWTVPFGARMYVEKMRCGMIRGGEDEDEELVRILVNDRVVPLAGCGADRLGRCRLSAFVDSLEFARNGGRWDECWI